MFTEKTKTGKYLQKTGGGEHFGENLTNCEQINENKNLEERKKNTWNNAPNNTFIREDFYDSTQE